MLMNSSKGIYGLNLSEIFGSKKEIFHTIANLMSPNSRVGAKGVIWVRFVGVAAEARVISRPDRSSRTSIAVILEKNAKRKRKVEGVLIFT